MNGFLLGLTAVSVAATAVGAGVCGAQGSWNDARALELMQRATVRRERQLADSSLRDYTATAHGYVTFLGALGDSQPPRIVKADELAVEVYWKAPNLSKQRIIGRRDSLLLPTDIQYHRDHLGIAQNNFPDIIRLGEGDEVADVPHPLSPQGLLAYDFAIADSLAIRLPDRTIDVYEVRVRPKVDTLPRLIGAVYVDRETAQVVRMAFSFTRAALLDTQLTELSIVLENALVANRYWLPRRQEIEIRRSLTWLDFPVQGIIRGRWEIHDYHVNVGLALSVFGGYEIVQAPQRELVRYPWTGRILDSLPPDVRAVADADVQRVRAAAQALVRQQALARATGVTLSAQRISDFVRVNRVEGFAVGGGVGQRLGGGVTLRVAGRYGTADRQGKGQLELGWRGAGGPAVRVFAGRDYREAGDVRETSLVRNSLAAQEFGSDDTDPYDVRSAGLGLELGSHLGVRWRLDGAAERYGPLAVHARPAVGHYERTIPAWRADASRLSLFFDREPALAPLGLEFQITGEVRALRFGDAEHMRPALPSRLLRVATTAHAERPVGDERLVLETTVGAVAGRGDVAPQSLVYLGGPVTGPGYGFHAFAAEVGISQHVEWQVPVPFLPIPLGRYGRTPGTATLAPFVHAVYVSRVSPLALYQRPGWYPAVGLGALGFFDLVRLDVARGLREGRWTVSFDVGRGFWGIL